MDNIFNKDFWLEQWQKDKDSDTFQVHKGFAAPDYWDKAAPSYDQDEDEISSRKMNKVMVMLENSGLLFKGMKVLDIGCGTGRFALALAHKGAKLTCLDFSKGMLEQFENALALEENKGVESRISILKEDWHKVNIQKKGWENEFDLVLAFMSPGVATPEAFFKMMSCSKNGCAVKGWAAKKAHPILAGLWEKIMGTPLEDKPQSILFKINLLFSLGYFPEITFDTVRWHQNTTVEEEFVRQVAFFKKISPGKPKTEFEKIIRPFLKDMAENGRIIRTHKGLTATAIWKKRFGD